VREKERFPSRFPCLDSDSSRRPLGPFIAGEAEQHLTPARKHLCPHSLCTHSRPQVPKFLLQVPTAARHMLFPAATTSTDQIKSQAERSRQFLHVSCAISKPRADTSGIAVHVNLQPSSPSCQTQADIPIRSPDLLICE
jgi:hypothetical protein